MMDEREIIATIRELQRRHQQELEPYFRRLAALRALRPPPPLLVDREWAEKYLIGVLPP